MMNIGNQYRTYKTADEVITGAMVGALVNFGDYERYATVQYATLHYSMLLRSSAS